MEPETTAPSPSSPADSNFALDALGLAKKAQLIATDPRDGRQQYRLPNGARLVLSTRRQAKKLIMRTEGLTPRQYKKLRKKLKREQRNGEKTRVAEVPAAV